MVSIECQIPISVVRASVGPHVAGKAKFCKRMVRWFFPGFSGFRPRLLVRYEYKSSIGSLPILLISELFLKGP